MSTQSLRTLISLLCQRNGNNSLTKLRFFKLARKNRRLAFKQNIRKESIRHNDSRIAASRSQAIQILLQLRHDRYNKKVTLISKRMWGVWQQLRVYGVFQNDNVLISTLRVLKLHWRIITKCQVRLNQIKHFFITYI